jgi:uncharacterized protein YbbC (DUF1343 family)
MLKSFLVCILCITSLSSCQNQVRAQGPILTGASRFDEYITLLNGQKVALVVNQSSLVNHSHLLDTLLTYQVNVTKIFAPEHGFRGTKDAGEQIDNNIDTKTGLPIISLYGSNKKPTEEQLNDVDVVLFDIQDVGVRFYTYISTMHYVMEACAQYNKKLIILDRPNPNGDYFDGPILKKKFSSFVGMHPIPVVHGLTVGELAQMINGEGWLIDSLHCDLKVVKVKNWFHGLMYDLPVKPSPNLPNNISLRLYPSLCFFEATNVSIGRGTYFPFQVIGYPDCSAGDFIFTPKSIHGMAKYPKQQDIKCYGIDLRKESVFHRFSLSYFISFYKKIGQDENFGFNKRRFNLLAGDDQLAIDIESGLSEEEIREKWEAELIDYSRIRDKYLLYPKEVN